MRINLTVNKSAGSKCSFTRKYRRSVMSELITKTLQWCSEEEFLKDCCCCCGSASTRLTQAEFMSPIKIKAAVIAALRFPAELATECVNVLTRIDRPTLPATR